jgi:DNA-binding response OmpR family regulator
VKTNNLIDDISILIVEDEIELQEYLQEYLQLFFTKVYSAKCGKDGYKQYLQKKPDIILSDINMPDIDGLSMIKLIREKDQDTHIIIMSAHSEQDKLLKAIELKLVTYLIKPVNTQKLKDILFELVLKVRDKKQRVYLGKNIYWDRIKLKLYIDNEEIILKEKESILIKLLISNLNHPFTTQDIFNYIYSKTNKEFSEYSITSLIKRVRLKIPKNIIHNEYGSGYKIIKWQEL